jgi:hypothetical protein
LPPLPEFYIFYGALPHTPQGVYDSLISLQEPRGEAAGLFRNEFFYYKKIAFIIGLAIYFAWICHKKRLGSVAVKLS